MENHTDHCAYFLYVTHLFCHAGKDTENFPAYKFFLNSYPNTLLNIIYNILPFQSARRVKYT